MLRNLLLLTHDISLLVLVLTFGGSRSSAVLPAAVGVYLAARAMAHRVKAVTGITVICYGAGALILYRLTGKLGPLALLVPAVAVVLGVKAAQVVRGSAFTDQLAARTVLAVVLVVLPSLVGYGRELVIPAALCIYTALLTAVVERSGRWPEAAVVTLLFGLGFAAVDGIGYISRVFGLVWFVLSRFLLLFVWLFLLVFGPFFNWLAEHKLRRPAELWAELAKNFEQTQPPVEDFPVVESAPGWVQWLVIAIAALVVLAVVILLVHRLRRGAGRQAQVSGLIREGISRASRKRLAERVAGQSMVYCDSLPPNNRKVCSMFAGYLQRLGYNPAQITSLQELPDSRLVSIFSRSRYSYREIAAAVVEEFKLLLNNKQQS